MPKRAVPVDPQSAALLPHSDPPSARVILHLVSMRESLRIGDVVGVDMDVIPANPYDDVWNNQPWSGDRKRTKRQVIDAMPSVGADDTTAVCAGPVGADIAEGRGMRAVV